MRLTIIALLFILIAMTIMTVIITSSNAGAVPPSAPALWQQPLPTPAEIQEHINAILQAHGLQGIEVDGVIGKKTRDAWENAVGLQMVYEHEKGYYEQSSPGWPD